MPQLIAMVIVVVGAMIYMFQTFGGTGDKIEGIAQKTSVITEINNVKNGLKLAARGEHIGDGADSDDPADASTNLKGLSDLAYFAEQINEQIVNNTSTGDDDNTYNAISFGGSETETGGMIIKLVASKAIGGVKMIPGIYVEFTGTLDSNKAFLEAQVANDLSTVAFIDRAAASAVAATTARGTGTSLEKRTPADSAATPTTAQLTDGKFIVYYRDFGADEVVK